MFTPPLPYRKLNGGLKWGGKLKEMKQTITFKSVELTQGQWDIVTQMRKKDAYFNIFCCSRQFGKSVLLSQLMLNDAINNRGAKLLYTSPILAQARKAYADLYNLIAPSNILKEYNKSELILKFINGSEIKFVGTDNADSLRGLSITYMYCDEFQFYKVGAWENVLRPMLSVAGKKVYIASTPRAKGSLFHTMYMKGQMGEDRYFSIHKDYRDNPLANTIEVEDARLNLPELIFRCEYLAEFIDNGGEVFKNISNCSILNTFKPPSPNERYYAGLDLARQHDFTVLTIMNEKKEVVYVYRDNKKEWDIIMRNIIYYLKYYNVKKCLVETNNIGDVVFDMLKKGGAGNIIIPFSTTNKSKQDIIEKLIVQFENMNIRIPSNILFPPLFQELSSFTYKYNPRTRTVKYEAPTGIHDDCVISLALANECGIMFRNGPPTFRTININGTNDGSF